MAIRIRTARASDLAAIQRVLAASLPTLMADAYEPALLARALPMMTRAQPSLVGSGTYYVALAGGEIVGCGGWSREAPDAPAGEAGVAHIRHFAVARDWIGRGVGRALYRRCEGRARAAGIRVFECYSSLNGEPFYRALGFTRLAAIEVPMAPGTSLPSIHMRREIGVQPG
ncbi:MAG TPA: GNAT family N-acetyltransferase [Allosphingosinicella sp.]|nr:GNAT family N-acetyltransferase [Allosphingosinicella sp.]